MNWYEAHVVREPYMDAYRLHLWARHGDQLDVLMEDGTWQTVDAAVSTPGVGMILPRDAWAAIIREAVPHADAGEVKELRAALELERSRVEKVIDRSLQ